jgi:hypothetical protein
MFSRFFHNSITPPKESFEQNSLITKITLLQLINNQKHSAVVFNIKIGLLYLVGPASFFLNQTINLLNFLVIMRNHS